MPSARAREPNIQEERLPNTEGRSKPGPTRVLVVAADPMVAALVGLLLDPVFFDPAFPLPLERPEDALARVRAPLVLMLDCDLDAARSDLFFARTTRSRATVVLFGGPGRHDDVTELGRLRGVQCVQLPTSRADLTAAIEAAITNAVGSGVWGIAAALVAGALTLTVRALAI